MPIATFKFNTLKKAAAQTAILRSFLLLCLLSSNSFAANWIALSSTEPAGSEFTATVFGWVQPEIQITDGSPIEFGNWAGQKSAANGMRPSLEDSTGLNIFRARLGARGRLNETLTYALLLEAGNGVITQAEGQPVVLLDFAITRDFDAFSLKMGQFKYPGSEEAQQAKYDYANFALPTAILVLESFHNGSGLPSSNTDANLRNGSVDAFRDIGVQLFKRYQSQEWEHTWALMLGQGNGLMRQDNNQALDYHLYWSSEKISSGKGKNRQGIKLFAWHRQGERTLTTSDAGNYQRIRQGFGYSLNGQKWQSTFEWIHAEGMIPFGTDGGAIPGSIGLDGSIASFNISPEAKADGGWIDLSYRWNSELETRLRYDKTFRNTNSPLETVFTNFTLGLNWYYQKQNKLMFNYEIRDFSAPYQSANHPINLASKSLDNRIMIQVFHLFRW